jgi:hypothetical protein
MQTKMPRKLSLIFFLLLSFLSVSADASPTPGDYTVTGYLFLPQTASGRKLEVIVNPRSNSVHRFAVTEKNLISAYSKEKKILVAVKARVRVSNNLSQVLSLEKLSTREKIQMFDSNLRPID